MSLEPASLASRDLGAGLRHYRPGAVALWAALGERTVATGAPFLIWPLGCRRGAVPPPLGAAVDSNPRPNAPPGWHGCGTTAPIWRRRDGSPALVCPAALRAQALAASGSHLPGETAIARASIHRRFGAGMGALRAASPLISWFFPVHGCGLAEFDPRAGPARCQTSASSSAGIVPWAQKNQGDT